MKKSDREIIFRKYNGKCAYCGISLFNTKWHVDHMLPLKRRPDTKVADFPERHTMGNMVASCASCNNYKHANPIEVFRNMIGDLKRQLERTTQYRIAKRFVLITETDAKVEFYFERWDKLVKEMQQAGEIYRMSNWPAKVVREDLERKHSQILNTFWK